MMKKKLLFIDTETGGVDPEKCSLLSIGLIVWDEGEIVFSKEIFVKNEIYHMTSVAAKINNIDISIFDDVGIEEQEVIEEFESIKNDFFEGCPMNIVGHNISFDASFIKNLYKRNEEKYSNHFSHRMVDTSSILQFLYYTGKIEKDISASDEALNYFKINVENRHSALDDCRATVELFNKLIKIIDL